MLSLAALVLAPNLALSETFFTLQIVDPTPEAIISEAELDTWKQAFPDFAKSEEALMAAYKGCLADVGAGGEGWLSMNQGDWAKARQETAYKNHAPKGEAAYIQALTQAAQERIRWLNEFAEKGPTVWVNNYLYTQPGYEGMVILYYRENGMELELYTKSSNGAICRAEGLATPAQGKARYNSNGTSFQVEMLELGKALELTSGSENGICLGGGKFTGTYELFK